MKNGFTMIELIFVIVIIGILSAVAIPKLMPTHDDALIVKGKSTLNTVRTALATEYQKREMSGDDTEINSLSAGGKIFDYFNEDGDGVKTKILLYPLESCTNPGCWSGSGKTFKFHLPDGGTCTYTLKNDGTFTTDNCPKLEE